MSKGRRLVLLGAAGLIIGALTAWSEVKSIFGTITVSGFDGDGKLTGGLGVILLLVVFLAKGKPGKYYSVVGSILALIAGVIAVTAMINISVIASDSDSVIVSLGAGLYSTALGAIIAFVGGLIREPPEPISEPAQSVETDPNES